MATPSERYDLMLSRICESEETVLRELRGFTITCGVLMIERDTDLMVFVEQRARDELPAGIIGIPKGVFERAKDRTFLDCAVREFCEETCAPLDVFRGATIGRWAMLFNWQNARVLYVFACVVDRLPPLKPGPEIAQILALDPRAIAQLPRKNMSKETAQIVRLIANLAQHSQDCESDN